MKKLILCGMLFTLLILISFNCTRLPVQPDINNIKLNLPALPYSYNELQTSSGIKYLRYEDSTLIDNNKATIGRVLFYDKALSINNSVSCASCHSQKNAFADNVAFSKGFVEKTTLRNSMSIVNLFDSRKAGYFWDGRESKIEDMVFAPIANHIEMGFQHIELITEKIGSLPYYKPLFVKCYGDDRITEKRMRECLAQFLFSIVSYNSKFDRSINDLKSNLTSSEHSGFLIYKEKCMSCHGLNTEIQIKLGTDTMKYANIGLDTQDKDVGRNGLYKIPQLRNVTKTAPYMHDGRFKTLFEALNHYKAGICMGNANLTWQFRGAWYLNSYHVEYLLAFLKTLEDETTVTDPKLSSPF